MKLQTKQTALLALAAILLAAVPTAWADNPEMSANIPYQSMEKPSFGKVEGVVRDAATGQVSENVYVCVEGCKKASMTNDAGKYFLMDVPSGTCMLKAVKKGFESVRVEVTVTRNRTATFKVEMKKLPVKAEEGA
jgi:hypothetical protein